MAALVVSMIVGVSGCGRSQEAQVRDALRERYPDGSRRCLQLAGDVVGIHVTGPGNGTLYFPSEGITSPLRHAYVFYAAPVAAPVPDLVRELSAQDVIHRTTVEATVDVEDGGTGPQLVSASGLRSREQWYRHETRTFAVAVYAVAPQDGRFAYATHRTNYGGPGGASDFPSRMYAGALPPADRHYSIPVVEPYALSIATAACFPETIGTIGRVRRETSWMGAEAILADVTFDQHAPDWMSSPAFRRAAMGPDTPSLVAPRKAVVRFRQVDGKLSYLGEAAP